MSEASVLYRISAAVVAAILCVNGGLSARAQTGGLPGGASASTETFKDWVVRCAAQEAPPDAKSATKPGDKAAAPPTRVCVLWQQSLNDKRQRVLTMELVPDRSGLKGALILPFGVKLADGAVLQIDSGGASKPFAFSTCLAGGCIVPLQLGPEVIAPLRTGQTLNILVSTTDGQQLKLAMSLAGFAPAYERIQKLTN